MLNQWYIACESRELKVKPLARTILGQKLAVFRDQQGRACALIDRCPHRNLALSRGRVTAEGLQCAYHGWSFNGEGKCTRIPASCETSGPMGIHARAYPVVEKQGVIWVFISDREAPPGSSVQPASPPEFPMFAAPKWKHWFMQRKFKGNAFNCVENFLDCPHTVFVHRHLFRDARWKDVECQVTSGEDWVQAEFLNETPIRTAMGKLLFPQKSPMVHTDKFTLPAITRVDYRFSDRRHFIIMSQCTPVSENETRVYTYMAFRFDPIAHFVRLLYEPYARIVLDQDVEIIRKQGEDLLAMGGSRFMYHPTDAIAREIRDLMDGKNLSNREASLKRLRF